MMISKKHLSRRTILHGAGTALALPLLDGMIPALTAASKTAARPVCRLGVVYVPNGMCMFDGMWTPTVEGTAFELTPILKPLAPFRNQLLVLSGLSDIAANALPGDGAGPHTRATASYLSGVHIKQTEGADLYNGITMDQLAARDLGKETQLASLELALEGADFAGACDPGYSCAYMTTISWRSPSTPLPMENDPRAVFERLFGAGGTTDPQARLAQLHRERSILDSVTESVNRLQKELGPSDRARVGEYLEGVRDIERRIQMAEQQNSRELPLLEQPTGGIPTRFEDYFRLMADLQVLAFQADLTRVSTFLMAKEQSTHSYPECGVAETHHAVSHHQYNPEKLAMLARINTYHVQAFTYLLEKLRSTPDGDGSLLDHSMILYGAGLSDSDRHVVTDLPVLVLGGGAGRLKGGRHLRYRKDTPIANLHLTLLDRMGIPVDRVGEGTERLAELTEI